MTTVGITPGHYRNKVKIVQDAVAWVHRYFRACFLRRETMTLEGMNLPQQQDYYVAQINIALMKAPLDDPMMAEFAAALDEVNSVADRSSGFVWRLQTESGNATDIQAFPNPRMLVNLSVWQSVEQLKSYVYKSLHGEFFVRRRSWFEKYQGEHFAMWWIPAGHFPTVAEGKAKLDYLTLHGDSPECFTFAKPWPPPLAKRHSAIPD